MNDAQRAVMIDPATGTDYSPCMALTTRRGGTAQHVACLLLGPDGDAAAQAWINRSQGPNTRRFRTALVDDIRAELRTLVTGSDTPASPLP